MARGREFRGGQYGNTRGKERQKRRRTNRENDPRYQSAMEATRKAQADLDQLIEEQKANPALGTTQGAMYDAFYRQAQENLEAAQAAEARLEIEDSIADGAEAAFEAGKALGEKINGKFKRFSVKQLPQVGDGNFPFAPTMAKQMLKQGYHIEYVLEFTGVGYEDVRDELIDQDGWGIRPEDNEDHVQDSV